MEEIVGHLEGERFGDTDVVHVSLREDPGVGDEEQLIFEIILTDPVRGEDTWSTDDTARLRSRVGDLAAASGLDPSAVAVVLYPEHPEDTFEEELRPERTAGS